MTKILEIFSAIFYDLEKIQSSGLIIFLKIISVLITLFLIYTLIQILIKGEVIKGKIKKIRTFWLGHKYEKDRTIKVWKRIVKLVKTGDELHRKQAIVLADKLLDEMLEKANWPGKTLTEKLENTSTAQMPDLNKMIEMHKISETIIQNPIFSITHKEALQILLTYEQTFQNFELIEK